MKVPPVRWRQQLLANAQQRSSGDLRSRGQGPVLKSRTQNLLAIRGVERRVSEPSRFFTLAEPALEEAPEDTEGFADDATSDTAEFNGMQCATTRSAVPTVASPSASRPKSAGLAASGQALARTIVGTEPNAQAPDEIGEEKWCTFVAPPPRPGSASAGSPGRRQGRPPTGRAELRREAAAPPWAQSGQDAEMLLANAAMPEQDALHADVSAMVSKLTLQDDWQPANARPLSQVNRLLEEEQKRPLSGRSAPRPLSGGRHGTLRPVSGGRPNTPEARASGQHDACRADAITGSSPAAQAQRTPRRQPLSARGTRRQPVGNSGHTSRAFSAGAPALPGGGVRRAREGNLTPRH